MSEEQQAVIQENESEAKPSDESQDAQEQDLDSLLKEYESEDKTEETQESTQQVAQSEDIQWLRQQRAEYEREQTEKAVTEAASMLKESIGDLPITMPDYVFEGILHQKASKDPRIIEAFNKRFTNPGGWQKIVKATGKQLSQDLQPKDQKATDSWNAVESAVHSASTSSPQQQDVDVSKMTDTEFVAYKQKLFGGKRS